MLVKFSDYLILTLGSIYSEILRVVDSLQLTANKKVATPADWKVSAIVQITILNWRKCMS